MRLVPRARRARARSAATPRRAPRRIPGAVLVLLGCLPGLLAVGALALCVPGAGRVVVSRPDRPAAGARPPAYRAARPRIVPRSAWLDRATGRGQPPPRYDDEVVAVFLHHTDSPNGYACADAPRIIRGLYAGQTGERRWDDIGYNFLVDRCGTVYEGRAGGVERAVTGAHTQGFNHRTAGIAALGTFTAGVPVPRPMTDAIAALAAWKLGLAGVDPRGRARLVSSSSLSRYRAGTAATLPALAGHDTGFPTSCPGEALTARLPALREHAALLQGRPPARPPHSPRPTPPRSRTAHSALPTPAHTRAAHSVLPTPARPRADHSPGPTPSPDEASNGRPRTHGGTRPTPSPRAGGGDPGRHA